MLFWKIEKSKDLLINNFSTNKLCFYSFLTYHSTYDMMMNDSCCVVYLI